MITFGRPEYINTLKYMWKEVFGDPESYIQSFFDQVYREENTLVYLEKDRVVSVLYMLPYKITVDRQAHNIAYLYALATDPAYRGKGIMSNLILKSLEISKNRDYALSVLIPASETLFDYYRKFGYVTCFEKVTITKTLEEISSVCNKIKNQTTAKLRKADAGEIWGLYSKSRYHTSDSIVLSKEQNAFYLKMLVLEGGEAVLLEIREGQYRYILCNLIEDNLMIYETDVKAGEIALLYTALLNKYNFKKVTFHQPFCFNEEEMQYNKKPFAMSKNLKGIHLKEPLINRVLM